MKKVALVSIFYLLFFGLTAQNVIISNPRSNKKSENIAKNTVNFTSDTKGYYFLLEKGIQRSLITYDPEGNYLEETSLDLPMFYSHKLIHQDNEIRLWTFKKDKEKNRCAGYYSITDYFTKFNPMENLAKDDMTGYFFSSSDGHIFGYYTLLYQDHHYVFKLFLYDKDLKKIMDATIDPGGEITPDYSTTSYFLDNHGNFCMQFIAKYQEEEITKTSTFLTIFNFKLKESKTIKLEDIPEKKPHFYQADSSSYVYYMIGNNVYIIDIENSKLIFDGDLLEHINDGKTSGSTFRELRSLAFTDNKIIGIYEDYIRNEQIYKPGSNTTYYGKKLVPDSCKNIYLYGFDHHGKIVSLDSITKVQGDEIHNKSFVCYFAVNNLYMLFNDTRSGVKSFLYSFNLETRKLSSKLITENNELLFRNNLNYRRLYEKKHTSYLMVPIVKKNEKKGYKQFYYNQFQSDNIFFDDQILQDEYNKSIYFSSIENKKVIAVLTKYDQVAFITLSK